MHRLEFNDDMYNDILLFVLVNLSHRHYIDIVIVSRNPLCHQSPAQEMGQVRTQDVHKEHQVGRHIRNKVCNDYFSILLFLFTLIFIFGGGGRLGFNHARMCVSKSVGNGFFFGFK